MRKTRGRRRRVPPFAVLAFIGLLIAVAAHGLIPYNDDEFLEYWPMTCGLFPGNAFENMCAAHWLRLWFTDVTLPLRSFEYVGSQQNILYFPLYFLWPHPISVRFFNMLMFAVQAVLYGKLFKRSPYVVFAGLVLFFPYFFQHLSDVGPIMVHTISVPLFLLLVRRWFVRGEWWPPVLAAVVVFIGVWSKLNYFWFLPSLALLTCMEFFVPYDGKKCRLSPRLVRQACVALAVFLLLMVNLIAVKNPAPDGSRPVWDLLMLSSLYESKAYVESFWSLHVVQAFLNPLEATQRVFLPFRPMSFMALYDALLYVFLPLVLIVPQLFQRPRTHALRAAIAFFAFVLMVLSITISKLSMSMHHAVLAYPFLIIAFLEILPALEKYWRDRSTRVGERAILVVGGALWVACNIGALAVTPFQPVRPDSDPGKALLYELFYDPRIADHYVITSTMWGTYFQPALFGPGSQSVLAILPAEHDKGAIKEAHSIARRLNRKLLIVTMNDGKNFWQYYVSDASRRMAIASYGLHRCEAVPVDSVWQVYLEDDGRADNPCFIRD